jgi:hypothetical protein
MSYHVIQPPFTLKFREMSKKDLANYYKWYLEALPKRIDELSKAVKRSAGFENWNGNYTPISLDQLGDWFSNQVEARQRTQEEVKEIASRLTFPMQVPGEELTDQTFSLAFDVGAYFSQMLLSNHPSLRWIQQFGPKSHVDYGQPVLVGFNGMAFNPTHTMVTLAYGIASKTKTGKRLHEL